MIPQFCNAGHFLDYVSKSMRVHHCPFSILSRFFINRVPFFENTPDPHFYDTFLAMLSMTYVTRARIIAWWLSCAPFIMSLVTDGVALMYDMIGGSNSPLPFWEFVYICLK